MDTPLPPVDEMPVLDDAVKSMKIDLAVSDTGEVLIFHEKPMPELVNWVEYNNEAMTLSFVSEAGRIQGLGIQVMERLGDVIAQAQNIFLIQRENGENKSAFKMPLIHL